MKTSLQKFVTIVMLAFVMPPHVFAGNFEIRSAAVSDARKLFEAEKEKIREAVKAGKMNRRDVREAIMAKRKEAVETAKAAAKAEIEKKKGGAKSKLRTNAKHKILDSLKKSAGNDIEKRKRIVEKLITEVEKNLSNSKLPQKTRVLLEAVRDSLGEISEDLKK